MRRKVNWKVLGGLVLGALLLGGAAFGVYTWQVRRAAADLLEQARRAEAEGRVEDAVDALGRYFAYFPRDTEQLARYGLLLDRLTTARARAQALVILEKVLRAEPQRDDLRRDYVRIALDLDRFADAKAHLAVLLRAHPDDAGLEHQMARCAEAGKEYDRAAEWYEKAAAHAPAQLDSPVRLAALLRRRLDQAERADQVIDAMVAANDDSFRAHLARARYRKEHGPAGDWEKDVARARALAPDEPDVLLATAEVAEARNDLAGARAQLQKAAEQHPRHVGLRKALAAAELQAGRPREAVACLKQGLEAVPGETQLEEALAEALLEAGEPDEAAATIEQLRKKGFPALWLDYLDARVLMYRGRWAEAARRLDAVRQKLTAAPERAAQVDLALARCHEQTGNPDQAVEAYQRSAAGSPHSAAARFGLASALAGAGRIDDALAECRQALALPEPPPGAALLEARLLALQALQAPAAARDWQGVEEALDRAAKAAPESAAVTVLRAEVHVAQGKPDRARAVLEEARGRRPEQPALWVALAALDDREGQPEKAAAVLDQAQMRLGERVEVQVARVMHTARRPGPGADAALAELEKVVDRLSADDRPQLLEALAEARYLRGQPREAERLWRLLVERRPNDLRARAALFDLALQAGDETELQRQAEAFKQVEGEEGTYWRYAEAARLMLLARRGDAQGLARARVYLTDLARRRPRWPRVALLAASLDELQGASQAAAENYQRALDLGERQLGVVRRLVRLLLDQQRYAEAEEVVRRLQKQPLAPDGLGRLAAEVSLYTQPPAVALEQARQVVPADSHDYHDHLWLGQLCAAAGKPAEAEAALRHAAELGGGAPAPWVALVQHLARTGQREKAEAALQEARGKLAPEQAPQALALACEALGQLDRAEEQHRAILAAAPEDAGALRAAAAFFLRTGQPRKAEPHLRKLLEARTRAPAAEWAWARRGLAGALAESGNYVAFCEALALLDQNKADGETVDDLRARAQVVATRPGRRREAVRLLEGVRQQRPLTDEEVFLLAQLHERLNEWPEARRLLDGLTASQGGNPQYLAYHARALVRHGAAEKARPLVAELAKREPQAFRTAEVKARLLKADGKGAEAAALLEGFAKADAGSVLPAAALLEELGEAPAAEALYRRHVSESGRPEGTLVLAAFLGRQARFGDALDLLDRAWQTCPAEAVAFAGVALLHHAAAEPVHFQRVERGLTQAVAREPGRTVLLLHLATLQGLQHRYADAEATYRQVLARDEGNAVALNNLAWLLAYQDGKASAALDLVQRAVAAAGPQPQLLDTRAVVYLALGKGAAAVKDLEEALADTPMPAGYFHLARARLLVRNRTGAAEALQMARDAGLKAETLHPLEQGTYQAVLDELNSP